VEGQTRRAALLRVLAAAASLVALLATRAAGLRPLDVALWTVLVPLLVSALLVLLPLGLAWVRRARRPRAAVVVPEQPGAVPDGVVQSRETAVEQARRLLLAGREREAPLEELLPLARALHEATLELAAATAAAGGHVPQALRDELALRERAATDPATEPATYG
jgi:hypothetical protein